MPPPTHIHKSMLFPGVKLPPPVLDKSDIAILKSKARHSGRDFGGAPLYDNTRRDPMDNHGRGGRINYAADRPPLNGPPPPSAINGNNPFAAFLDPKFAPGMPVQSHAGYHPPPHGNYGGRDHQYQGQRSTNGYSNGYQDTRRDQYGYQGSQNGGYRDQHQDGQRSNYHDDRSQYQHGGYHSGGRNTSDGYQGRSRGGSNNYAGNNSGGYDQRGAYNRR